MYDMGKRAKCHAGMTLLERSKRDKRPIDSYDLAVIIRRYHHCNACPASTRTIAATGR